MIAGAHTPFTVRFHPDGMAIAATAGVWSIAVAGASIRASIKLRCPRRFERLAIVAYLVLGWQGLFLVPSLLAALPEPAALLIVTGACCIQPANDIELNRHRVHRRRGWHDLQLRRQYEYELRRRWRKPGRPLGDNNAPRFLGAELAGLRSPR